MTFLSESDKLYLQTYDDGVPSTSIKSRLRDIKNMRQFFIEILTA